MSKLKVGSLFTGIGGFDLGFEQAGMEVEWQCDMEYNWNEWEDSLRIYIMPMNSVCRDGEEIYHEKS